MSRPQFEQRFLPKADNPDVFSRAVRELRAQPYQASIPVSIAKAVLNIDPAALAEADDASSAITRFDAQAAAFPAPFPAVLLRSESASSSQIENLSSDPRAIADAALAGLHNASVLTGDFWQLQDAWDRKMSALRSDASARKIVQLSLELPVLNLSTAVERTGFSQPAVSNAFNQLSELGILAPANSKLRKRIWINNEVVAALEAFTARAGRRQKPGW